MKHKARSILICFSVFASFASVASSQDLSKTIVPITDVKWIGVGVKLGFGTGFCIDPECRLIGTNYHVASIARPKKIKGDKVIQRYLATGPDDEGATANSILFFGGRLKYALVRDLAIFELERPLPHYHGIPFSLNDLQLGQEVDIYAYPKESISPIRSLLRFHGSYKGESTGGLLAFDYTPSNGKSIRPGASGGLVVDSKSQEVVGILNAVAISKETVAMAVPVQSLADFVSKVQPWIAQNIFPTTKTQVISPTLADLYPKFQWPAVTGSLQHRTEEPVEVKALRLKAQILADSMRNFVAVETFSWGRTDSAPGAMAEYEVQVLEGLQRFREYPDGKKELKDVPFPLVNTVVNPGGQWSELPQMVGSELHLKIHQAADTVVNGRPIKVFQYVADVEDGVCIFKSVRDYGFFEASKIVTIPCHGEVWTDEDLNILRISQHLQLPARRCAGERQRVPDSAHRVRCRMMAVAQGDWKEAEEWQDYQSVVTYGWLRLADNTSRLAPLTISTQAEFKHKVYWCRGLFTNYRMFSSQTKIMNAANYNVQSLPP